MIYSPARLHTPAANFSACISAVSRGCIITCSNLALLISQFLVLLFDLAQPSPHITRAVNAVAMKIFDSGFPICLVLFAQASSAYPSKTRSQSLNLISDTSPKKAISQVSLTNPGGYPVYPTKCFPPPWLEPDLDDLITDCYFIINEVLLRKDDLLFQYLLFRYTEFEDQSGIRYGSQWHHGRCVINVSCAEEDEAEMLQLSNVILAANKILRECIQAQRIPQGGTTHVGSPNGFFQVGVQERKYIDAADEAGMSLLSDLDLPGRETRRIMLSTVSNSESPALDVNAKNSAVAPGVTVERRGSDAERGSSLSTGTHILRPGSAFGGSDLALPAKNLSASVKAPPIYPVTCFNPYSVELKSAAAEDCQFIIDHVIMSYPNPMSPQTFGYSASVDVDLALSENGKWVFGECAIFVRNPNKRRVDTFRMVDVAITATRVLTECVVGARYPVGGKCVLDAKFLLSRFFFELQAMLRKREALDGPSRQSIRL